MRAGAPLTFGLFLCFALRALRLNVQLSSWPGGGRHGHAWIRPGVPGLCRARARA